MKTSIAPLVRKPLPLLLTALLGAGCTGPELTSEDYDDVAQSLAVATAEDSGGDIASLDDALALAEDGSAPAMTRSQSGTYSGSRGGLTYSYTVTCHDAGGQVLAACDETAASADIQVAWSGDIATARYQASVDRNGQWQLTGLGSDAVHLAGTGEFALDSTFTAIYRDVERSLLLDYTADYQDVVLDPVARRPVGGEVHFAVSGERTRTTSRRDAAASFDIDAVLAFSPDGATLTLDGTRTYTVDVQTGTVVSTDGQ